jgi:hypothetical protein
MGRLRRATGRTVYLVLFSLGWASCSSKGTQSQSRPPIPFRDEAETVNANAGADASSPSGTPSLAREADVPFHDPQSLPTGTLITVRLSRPVSFSSKSSDRLNDVVPAGGETTAGAFEAIVDESVVIDGATVVPRGASVAGRVEYARSSMERAADGKLPGAKNRPGYVRLTLDSMDVAGQSFAIRTSSLFARGRSETAPTGTATIVSVEQGRRLTFRLSEPVYVAVQPIISSR